MQIAIHGALFQLYEMRGSPVISKAKNKAQKDKERRRMLKRRYQRSNQKGRAITKATVFGESEDS
jgi:hypothetical protein